jgi:hypothetical protein
MVLLAQDELGKIQPPPGITPGVAGLEGFIAALVQLLIMAAGITSFVLLVVGGIQWSISGGDPKANQAARGRVTAAIVGLVIVLSSFAIIRLVEYFLNIKVDIFKIPIP